MIISKGNVYNTATLLLIAERIVFIPPEYAFKIAVLFCVFKKGYCREAGRRLAKF